MSAETIEQIKKAEEKVKKHTQKAEKWRRRVFDLLMVQQDSQQAKIKEIGAE